MAYTWRWRTSGELLHVSLAAGTLTISFGGHTNLSFDGEGRLVGAWYGGRTYRRSLDNRVLAKWTESDRPSHRRRQFLSETDARDIIRRSYADAERARQGLAGGMLLPVSGTHDATASVLRWLETVARWDYEALAADAAHFHRIYKPVSILPPDQYLSVVLQATEGCSYNECSFCTFYRDRAFQIKSPPEFSTHVAQVRSFLGRGLFIRRTIFLADANAIVIPQARLLPLLECVNESFRFQRQGSGDAPAVLALPEDWAPGAINAFVSAPDALRKSVDDLRTLAAMRVQRLYVGLESGHDPLRHFLRKPGSAADVQRAVTSIKQAGLEVGLIFMVGIGGEAYREPHFRDTVGLIQSLPLSGGDIVYISPFVPSPGSPYLSDMQRAGYPSLGETEIQAEEVRFRSALRPLLKRRGVRISRYDIREFVY